MLSDACFDVINEFGEAARRLALSPIAIRIALLVGGAHIVLAAFPY